MGDMPEQARRMQRLIRVVIIVGAFAALAYVGTNLSSSSGEKACPEGEEWTRANSLSQTPRFTCKPIKEETNDVEN